jgi:hypothetical protein
MHLFNLVIVTTGLSLLLSPATRAQEDVYSSSLMGPVGLNTIPSARMDKAGTVKLGASTLDPYQHTFIGFQLADPVYIQLRQSAEISSLGDNPERLYPGIDFKFRLSEEGRYQPEVALGLNSGFGHKRMASEYFALSKRFWDVDFTSGIAWGRMAGSGHLRNPLGRLSRHFKSDRNFNSDSPNTPHDWFTGEEIGLFAGFEYFTPLEGLSIKADWGADDFIPEKTAGDYHDGGPWSASLNYTPAAFKWASLSVGTVGTNKIFARLSLQNTLDQWPFSYSSPSTPIALRPHRTEEAIPIKMMLSAGNEGLALYDTDIDGTRARGNLDINPYLPPALQIGRAVRHMANHAGPDVASLEITPRTHGLKGQSVRIMRRDLESAAARNNGSPEEIWADASFFYDPDKKASQNMRDYDWWPRLIWDNAISLSEEDTGYLYRTAMIFEETKDLPYGFTVGGSVRWNMADNLHRLAQYRTTTDTAVRSDIDLYASRALALDRSYVSWFHTVAPDVHVALSAGALEEMYTGAGGEILYRPFGKTFAFGFEAWHVYKRDPASPMTINVMDIDYNTAFLNAWYEVPGTDMTLYAKAGRFLGEDDGISGGLEMNFDNGAKLAGFITATDRQEPDIFGGKTHLYGGLRLSLPFGSFRYIPDGSEIRVRAVPLGRDSAQELDKPLPLYEVTEPMSYRRIAQSWQAVLN